MHRCLVYVCLHVVTFISGMLEELENLSKQISQIIKEYFNKAYKGITITVFDLIGVTACF